MIQPVGACPPDSVAVSRTCPPKGTPPDAVVDIDGLAPAAYTSANGDAALVDCETPTAWHQLTARQETAPSPLLALPRLIG